MGLFWSMNPPDGDPDQAVCTDPTQAVYFPPQGPSFTVDLTVAAGDRQLATRTLTRRWVGDGVTVRALRTGTDHVAGCCICHRRAAHRGWRCWSSAAPEAGF
jgi:Acyl-CoA thioester hydrolase/BAAT N-terminal region